MDMLMIVFRTSLKERVHEILRSSGVMAYTEFPETAGTGQSVKRDKVAGAVKGWCAEAQHSGWVKPAIRVFSWPCTQLI